MDNSTEIDSVRLISPEKAYKDSYIDALYEFEEEEGRPLDPKIREMDFDFFLRKLKEEETLHTEIILPSFQYWLVDGDKYIGRVNYRPILNDAFRFRGGNIGYNVRPTERGKGYATIMLKKSLEKAKADGLSSVLLTCDTDNIPSIKVIEKAGGVFQGTDTSDKGLPFNRYVISLW